MIRRLGRQWSGSPTERPDGLAPPSVVASKNLCHQGVLLGGHHTSGEPNIAPPTPTSQEGVPMPPVGAFAPLALRCRPYSALSRPPRDERQRGEHEGQQVPGGPVLRSRTGMWPIPAEAQRVEGSHLPSACAHACGPTQGLPNTSSQKTRAVRRKHCTQSSLSRLGIRRARRRREQSSTSTPCTMEDPVMWAAASARPSESLSSLAPPGRPSDHCGDAEKTPPPPLNKKTNLFAPALSAPTTRRAGLRGALDGLVPRGASEGFAWLREVSRGFAGRRRASGRATGRGCGAWILLNLG